jgi:hypothetical protein
MGASECQADRRRKGARCGAILRYPLPGDQSGRERFEQRKREYGLAARDDIRTRAQSNALPLRVLRGEVFRQNGGSKLLNVIADPTQGFDDSLISHEMTGTDDDQIVIGLMGETFDRREPF